MRKRKSDHRAPQPGGARVIFGATRARECIQSARGKVSRRTAPRHPISTRRAASSPAFRGIWWPTEAVRADSAAGSRPHSRRRAGHDGRAVWHRTRRTRWHLTPPTALWLLSAFPQEICRLAAGWLSEGARAPTTCAARRCSAPLFTCIARAVPLAPQSAAVVLSRAVEPCCLLLVSAPSLP